MTFSTATQNQNFEVIEGQPPAHLEQSGIDCNKWDLATKLASFGGAMATPPIGKWAETKRGFVKVDQRGDDPNNYRISFARPKSRW